MQREIVNKGKLLDEKGNLIEKGYARSLIKDYDRKDVKAPKWRLKEWDYYLVMGQDFGVAFTISDDGYIGLQSVSLLDFTDEKKTLGTHKHRSYTFPHGQNENALHKRKGTCFFSQ